MNIDHTYPTVEELLRLPAFAGSRVCGGADGLRRPVRGVNTTDIPDYAGWLSPGEMLVTTGFALAGNDRAVAELLPTASRCGLAAVCIKPGRYLPKPLPPPMYAQADRLALPLVELPGETRFAELSAAVAREISRRRVPAERQRELTACLRALIDGQLTGDAAEQQAVPYGVHPQRPHLILRLRAPGGLVRALAQRLSDSGLAVWQADPEEDRLLVLEPEDEERVWEAVRTLAAGWPQDAACGVGRSHAGPEGFSLADKSARAALARAVELGMRCCRDDPAGLIRLMESRDPDAEMSCLTKKLLAPVLEQPASRRRELLETLSSWVDCFGNQRRMARQLHLHYNTVAYRLQQLWELLPLDPEDPDQRLALSVAVYLYRCRGDICP